MALMTSKKAELQRDTTGWAVAVTCNAADCNPYRYPKALVKTTDGGQTWQILQPQIIP
jgi:hypothetical protein